MTQTSARARIEQTKNGFLVTVDTHYFFSFAYDGEGLLAERSASCQGSEEDEKMMRAKRPHALDALEAAGHMRTVVTPALNAAFR
jgi:hypothetical protein